MPNRQLIVDLLGLRPSGCCRRSDSLTDCFQSVPGRTAYDAASGTARDPRRRLDDELKAGCISAPTEVVIMVVEFERLVLWLTLVVPAVVQLFDLVPQLVAVQRQPHVHDEDNGRLWWLAGVLN